MRKRTNKTSEPLIRLIGLAPSPDVVRLPTTGCDRSTAPRVISMAALAVAGLSSGTAVAAPGDLDPTFGDVGRVNLAGQGELWSAQVPADESIQFAGGYDYCYYSCYTSDELGRLDAFGAPDPTFAAATLDHTFVYDTVLLGDGRLVGTGYVRGSDGHTRLVIFRLLGSGALDTTFGLNGQLVLSPQAGSNEAGSSLLVENDGRIVVVSNTSQGLVVRRLLDNGSPDTSFGTDGSFMPSAVNDALVGGGSRRITRAPNGGYRILTDTFNAGNTTCSVIAVTAAGTLDATFGNAGVWQHPGSGSTQPSCSAFATLPDGSTLLAGRQASNGYLGHVLATGALDDAFDGSAVATYLADVTALRVSSSGRIFVAGPGPGGLFGATVARLLATGAFDTAFGRGGAMTLDLQSERANTAAVRDIQVRAHDAVVLAGGFNGHPFVARLLGDVATAGPGVLGFTTPTTIGTRQSGAAVVKVRRTGGSQGAVTVSYLAKSWDGGGATAGQDFTAVAGDLAWPDGDASDKEITVPIAPTAPQEDPESFELVLSSPTGGSGLAATIAGIEIAGSSYPHGDLVFETGVASVEEQSSASFYVTRQHYGQGEVSVTVRVSGGNATPGRDFTIAGTAADQVTLHWDDGDMGGKTVTIHATARHKDLPETVQLQLVAPTGGASVGTRDQMTVTITPSPAFGGNGGGGLFAGLESLLLGLLALGGRRRGVAGPNPPGRTVGTGH